MDKKVKIIAITKPIAEDLIHMSTSELTAYIARVSNPSNQMNNETADKLLKYCIKNQHWSVFEHVNITFEIKTSRAIAAQILRHRSAVFQEFSQRYAKAFEVEIYEARRQDDKNRQNSIDDMSQEDKDWFRDAQWKNWEASKALYDEALDRGIAKEQARFFLPLGTKTTMYMTNNLRNWLHYVSLRSHEATQLEHRVLALEIKELVKEQVVAVAQAMGW